MSGRPERYAAFLTLMRELRPVLRTPARIFEWWNRLLDPVLESIDQEKGLAREAVEHTFDLLSIDENDDPAAWNEAGLGPFIDRLLTRWMEVMEKQAKGNTPSIDLKEKMLKQATLIFGKKDPKAFMVVINDFFVKRDYRNNALFILADFIIGQPPHLHLVLQTPLFANLIYCLQIDESTSTVNMALISVAMLIPSMPSSIVSLLPTLFNIYARMLFWDRESLFAKHHTEGTLSHTEGSRGATRRLPEDMDPAVAKAWEKCSLQPDHDGNIIFYLPTYFTILYGLYPLNFMDYIRKPQRYLRHANYASDSPDVQAVEIRERSGRFRETHRLHPNFYNLTVETEKTDFSRWLKAEADEVLTACIALQIETPVAKEVEFDTSHFHTTHLAQLGEDEDPDYPPLLDSSMYADTPSLRENSSVSLAANHTADGSGNGRDSIRSGFSQSSIRSGREKQDYRPREVGGDSPTLPPHLIQSSSHTRLQDLIHGNRLPKSSLSQSQENDSVPSLALSPHEMSHEQKATRSPQMPAKIAVETGSAKSSQAARLYQEGLALLSNLQFERFIKQQHMSHMGELRRKQIREAATEAETQTLVMANRSLKQRLDEAKRQELQTKKENDHRREMAQKRESDLSVKLRALREEQKRWEAESTALNRQLCQAQSDCGKLQKMVEEAEARRLKTEQDLIAVDISSDEIEKLKAEITRLSMLEHEYQGKELKLQRANEAAEAAVSKAEQRKAELAAQEHELQQASKRYEAQIASLSSRLSEALKANAGGRTAEATAMFEGALASSRARQAELQKQYSALMRKYTVLQSSLLDMRCDSDEKGRNESGASSLGGAAGDTEMSPAAGSPIGIRNRGHRGFSDPEMSDSITSHNATSPLDPISTSLGSGSQLPSMSLDAEKLGTSPSPQAERYFGRGKPCSIRTREAQ